MDAKELAIVGISMRQRVVFSFVGCPMMIFFSEGSACERLDSHLACIAAREAECKDILMPLLCVYLDEMFHQTQPYVYFLHIFAYMQPHMLVYNIFLLFPFIQCLMFFHALRPHDPYFNM